eukprot:scaffold29456_cov34-Phaeocystis_antarctica.AAC.1
MVDADELGVHARSVGHDGTARCEQLLLRVAERGHRALAEKLRVERLTHHDVRFAPAEVLERQGVRAHTAHLHAVREPIVRHHLPSERRHRLVHLTRDDL